MKPVEVLQSRQKLEKTYLDNTGTKSKRLRFQGYHRYYKNGTSLLAPLKAEEPQAPDS
jgi:hypothetical protein